MNNPTKCIGSKCPTCNSDLYTQLNLFALNAGPIVSYCDECGERALEIAKTPQGIDIHIPCFICNQVHSFRLAVKSFLPKPVFALSCGDSTMDILYIGNPDDVTGCMCSLNTELETLLSQNTCSCLDDISPLFQLALREINTFALQGKVICLCGLCELNAYVKHGGINVVCKNCNAHDFIPLRGEEDLDQLKHRRTILLTKPKS